MKFLRRWLLDYLACPKCKSSLKISLVGELECICGSFYPVKKGVPSFCGDNKKMRATADAFSDQWRYRNKGLLYDKGIYGFSIEDYTNHFKYVFKLSDLKLLEGKVVLEAGCGPGEMIAAIGGMVPSVRLIGLDISDALYNASQKTVSIDDFLASRAFLKTVFHGDQASLPKNGGGEHGDDSFKDFR